MPTFSQTALVRYCFALLLVGVAMFSTVQSVSIATYAPFTLFFAAVLVATYFGGHFPGLFSLVLSIAGGEYFIIYRSDLSTLDLFNAIQLGTFVPVALLIVWLTAILRKRGIWAIEKESRYDFLFETNPLPMWIVDPDSLKFLAVNGAATSNYGYSRDEFLEMTVSDLLVDQDIVASNDEPSRIDRLGEPFPVSRHRRKDGSMLYVETIAHELIFDSRPAKLIHTIDVTERLETSAALLASEARLLSVFANCPIAVAVTRWCDDTFVDVNAEFLELTGGARHRLLGRTAVDCGLIDQETMMGLRTQLGQDKFLTDQEVVLTTQTGETLDVLMGGVFVEMMGEKHVITTFVDITKRKQSDEELRVSEERLRIVTENARVGLVMINEERRFTFANAAYADLFDLTDPNIVGLHVSDIHPQRYETQIRPSLDRVFAGERLRYELRQAAPDGEHFFDVRYEPTRANGKVSSVVAVVTDITERNRAELAREASEERYRTLFEYAPDGIAISDPQSFYLDANEALCRMLGCSKDEFVGLHATDIVVPKEIPHLQETLGGLNADLEYYQEWQFRRRDGSVFPGEVIATKMPDGNTLAVIRDTTERKHLEDQLLQAQKMEAIGVLAGGVAHDFNNILTAISGYSDLALENQSLEDSVRNYIMEIRAAGNRAAALTGQLLAFSRKRILMPTVHNLNVSVMDTEKMLRRIVKENINFEISLDPKLGNIKADPGQMAQVIVNLVVNAGDAMPNGGKLTIATRNVNIGHNYSGDNISVMPGPFAELTVTDTGIGMDQQTQRRLFEPFFTTKEIGKGTGLGLSTAYGIVKQSGGDIEVASEPGLGSTFKILLPCVEEAIVEPPITGRNDQPGDGSETILLVEDELPVRLLVQNILTRNGHRVLVADSGERAIEICRLYQEDIHLLLTDMILPKIGGRELSDEITKLRPGIKSLFMSGYVGDSNEDKRFTIEGRAFIEKPFTPNQLITKIREELADSSTQNFSRHAAQTG